MSALFAALVPVAELREALRKILQLSQISCAFGLPRRVASATDTASFSGPHVVLTLSDDTHFERLSALVALPAGQALALVDRCLGGPGTASAVSMATAPTEAECGVLAYLAARCVRICAPTLRLRDVTVERHLPTHGWAAHAVLWPMRVVLGAQLELELTLILSEGWPLLARETTARLVISDELEAGLLDGLHSGDLLLLDGWPCTFTAQGLSGILELTAEGYSEPLRVALEGEALRALPSPSARARTTPARLVVHAMRLSFRELAALCSAERSWCVPALQRAELEVDGQPAASGELVRYGGALALRVDAVHSMR